MIWKYLEPYVDLISDERDVCLNMRLIADWPDSFDVYPNVYPDSNVHTRVSDGGTYPNSHYHEYTLCALSASNLCNVVKCASEYMMAI